MLGRGRPGLGPGSSDLIGAGTTWPARHAPTSAAPRRRSETGRSIWVSSSLEPESSDLIGGGTTWRARDFIYRLAPELPALMASA